MSTKKLQIMTPIVTSVNGEVGDVTVSGGFLCTITGKGTDADPYVCDKSFDEIIQAVDNGFIPYYISGEQTYGDQKMMYIYNEYIYSPYSKYIILINDNGSIIRHMYIFSSGKVEFDDTETDIPTITIKTWTSSDIT